MQSVLGSLVLGYRPLWGAARSLAGVQLYVREAAAVGVDAPHLLRTVQEMWSASSPPLLISPLSRQLLSDLLEHAPRGSPWILVPGQWLGDSALFAQVQAAHQRGLRLVWRGPLGRLPEPEVARCFDNSLLSLQPEEAMAALQASPPPRPGAPHPPGHGTSPVVDGQMYEDIASRALMSHCLDEHRAVALAGWPKEDVLYSLRHQPMQPAHATILKLLKAIDAEQSLDVFEGILGEDPLLAGKMAAAVVQPRLEGALDGVVGDRDLAHLAGLHHALELAVGHGLHGAHLHPQVVEGEDREQREDEIPQAELEFLLHGVGAGEAC